MQEEAGIEDRTRLLTTALRLNITDMEDETREILIDPVQVPVGEHMRMEICLEGYHRKISEITQQQRNQENSIGLAGRDTFRMFMLRMELGLPIRALD